MGLVELFIIAVGLSMDAFAVAVCQGLSMKKAKFKDMLIVGLYFGISQALMPLLGHLLGSQFASRIMVIDHWVSFVLLGFIGIKMIKESFEKNKCDTLEPPSLRFSKMLPLAIATSIDALAVGVSFAFLNVDIWHAIFVIGITTFILSIVGVKMGNVFGGKFKAKAEFIGGLILVLMGIKILAEHLID